jgi:pyruvate/2-oxoglutarate/acetoin dehydrogenase E1 component
VREGTDLTIITWGAMVQKSIEAAQTLEAQDASIEIIDLRTLNPLDLDTIEQSLKKTGKALVVYEDNLTNGPGAEISALIADRFFEYLDGPIRRVATKDSPIPYNWFLEEKILAQTQDISEAITELLEY